MSKEMQPELSNKELVIALVNQIPKGRISSFGRIGDRTGINPRIVGFILSGMTQDEMQDVPWHRVVNKDGFISPIKLGDKGRLQASMLEDEGIEVIDFQIQNFQSLWWDL